MIEKILGIVKNFNSISKDVTLILGLIFSNLIAYLSYKKLKSENEKLTLEKKKLDLEIKKLNLEIEEKKKTLPKRKSRKHN